MVLGNGGSLFCLEYLNTHTNLGVDFTGTGAWDICIIIKNVLDNGRKKVNQLSNRNINSSARRSLLVVVRPTLEYEECGKPTRLGQLR